MQGFLRIFTKTSHFRNNIYLYPADFKAFLCLSADPTHDNSSNAMQAKAGHGRINLLMVSLGERLMQNG